MPIRSKPFTGLTLEDVRSLVARRVPEDRTLEYKRALSIEEKENRIEFLKDISAMANAAGGTIIFGVTEGEEEERGLPVAVEPVPHHPDVTMAAIDHLVKDGLDERLTGVLQRALPAGEEGFVYVLRIPASPLAPHMITLKTSGPRFYLRANTVNVPMNVRQIKESVMQRAGAIDNAKALVEHRTQVLRERAALRTTNGFGYEVVGRDQVILHVVPLYPAPGGWNLGDPGVEARLNRVPALGAYDPYGASRYTVEGMGNVFDGTRHVLFLRSGAAEFQLFDPLHRPGKSFPGNGTPQFDAYHVECAVLAALEECRKLTEDGLLPLPALVSLRVLDVEGSVLRTRPGSWYGSGISERALPHADVPLEPVLITNWDPQTHRQVQRMLDELWQAWGFRQSWNFEEDGTHRRFGEDGSPLPPLRSASEPD